MMAAKRWSLLLLSFIEAENEQDFQKYLRNTWTKIIVTAGTEGIVSLAMLKFVNSAHTGRWTGDYCTAESAAAIGD